MKILLRYKLLIAFGLLVMAFLQFNFLPSLKNIENQFLETVYQQEAHRIQLDIEEQIAAKQQVTLVLAIGIAATLSNNYDLPFSNLPVEQKLLVPENFEKVIAKLTKFTNFKNLWFRLMDENGHSVYQSWSPLKNHLQVSLSEFSHRKKHPKPQVSISSGKFNLSIRTLVPVLHNETLLGYVELMSHFNSIQKKLEVANIDSLVIASPEQTLKITSPFSHKTLHGLYISNLNPNQSLLDQIRSDDLASWIGTDKDYWLWNGLFVVRHPLKALDGQVHGWLFAFKPKADIVVYNELNALVAKQSKLEMARNTFITTLFFIALAFYFYRQKRYYHNVIDVEKEMVIIADTAGLIYANKAFFKVFKPFSNLRAFSQKHDCICEFFVPKDGYLQCNIGGLNWLEYLAKNSNKQHKVKIDYNGKVRVYDVRASLMPGFENRFVAVFNNITLTEKLHHELRQKALMDSLTRIGNHRHFKDNLKRDIKHSNRYHIPFSMIMFDIDHFKMINDTYGHDVGDSVLRRVAKVIKALLREDDEFYRIGGEEFAILLMHQSEANAVLLAEKIRIEIENTDFSPVKSLTISLGAAQYKEQSRQEFFKQTDNALYRAKNAGRNQTQTPLVEVISPVP